MLEKEIIKKFKAALNELLPIDGLNHKFVPKSKSGISSKFDLVADVSFENLKFEMVIEVVAGNSLIGLKGKLQNLKLAAKEEKSIIPVLVAPYLSPERQALCRKEGVGFLDLSGNAHLHFKSFYIERTGSPNRFPEKRYGRDPFSDKASLVLRALLQNGERLWGVRELAQYIGLDPGYVSRMAKEIESRGYAARVNAKLRLRSLDGILDDWVRSYSFKKNKLSRYFCMAASVEEVIHKLRDLKIAERIQYALSIHAGASLVAPFSSFKEVHVYVSGARDLSFFENELALKPAEIGANLILMQPYYRNSVYFGARIVDDIQVVSDIQLYLDLHGYPIRGLEQAEHILNQRIKPASKRTVRR